MPIVLAALLRLIVVSENWLVCAGFFAIARAVGGFVFSEPMGPTIMWSGIAFVVSALYFFLLTRMTTRTRWWSVAILGFPIFLL